jgi:hypothetical protein
MGDYNKGALPDPCLRLAYGFGDDWASVELGDGTGYVKLTNYEQLKEFARDACTVLRSHYDTEWFDETVFAERMHELGIEIEVEA